MVTTRSADRRLDASRGEDLVLRSRTIGSPSSVASTPSRPQKRTASSRENTDSLRSKRVRTETIGTTSSKTTHVVVNVPVISTSRENHSTLDEVAENTGVRAGVGTTLDGDHTETDKDSDQATPYVKVTTTAETPDQGGETFQTPATSRHKRFDSEEPDDDTIIVGTAIDSSAPQGYHTAEEEIAESDNDDDAPDVESTKVVPKLPQRKSARTAKGKKPPASASKTIDVDNETIEVDLSQTRTESESLTVGKESPVSEDSLEQVTNVEAAPGQETLDKNSIPFALGPVHSQTTIDFQPSTNTEQSQILPPLKNQEAGSVEDADVESVTVSDSTLQDLFLTERKTPSQIQNVSSEVSGPAHSSFFPHILGRSTETPRSKAVRLPAKAASGSTDYRRRKFQQKVAGSAGGFKMQVNWPKKRSSFVVS